MNLLEYIFSDIDPNSGLVMFANKTNNRLKRRYAPLSDLSIREGDMFFGPAVRREQGPEKSHCLGTFVLWVDVDHDDNIAPCAIIPPSAVVHSGHGWHLYWRLNRFATDFDAVERVLKNIIEELDADKGTWDITRLLRIPGTWNTKQDPKVLCTLRELHPDRVYSLEDFEILPRVSEKIRRKILTGDRRGFPSRSERDWHILRALITTSASDDLIRRILAHHECGDKYREDGEKYLARTLKKLREKTHLRIDTRGAGASPDGFRETPDGLFIDGPRGSKQVSTFVFRPELLLESEDGSGDALLGRMLARDHEWPDILLTRKAFNGGRNLSEQLPIAAWQWLGTDAEVRKLLPYCMDLLQVKGTPRVRATKVLGRHEVNEQAYFVLTCGTLSKDGLLSSYEAPIAYFPTGRMTTEMDVVLDREPAEDLLQMVGALNEPEVIWPILGWWAATPFKPILGDMNVRFPILNVAGTRGSGKSTTLKKIMMPLFGISNPRIYNAQSTRFVLLSLFGSTNAIPVALTEYRHGGAEDDLLRYLLLLYDTGYDSRGRPDQTTVEYPLLSPLVIDGEDIVTDPAARERTIIVNMHPRIIAEGSEAWLNFQEFLDMDLAAFAGAYLQYTLTADVGQLWSEALESVFNAFPVTLPDRVRQNIAVVYFGVLAAFDFMGQDALETVPPMILGTVLKSIFAHERGRAPVAADDFVEAVVSAVGNARKRSLEFFWYYDGENNVVRFPLTAAHSWWQRIRRQRLGSPGLGRDAMRAQLKELETEYTMAPQRVEGSWCYGVDLKRAFDVGLDVPEVLDMHTVTITY